jgi:hypothetical protein
MRMGISAVLVGLAVATAAQAQTGPLRFHWQKGQVLTYRVEHVTAVAEVVGGNKVATSSKLNLTKRWEVLALAERGVATLQLSLAAMRTEQTRPNGEVLLYDSANPDKSTPALKEQLEKFINQPLAVLKVDGSGKVVEVVKGTANRFESEPPFILTLPAGSISAGQSWERAYKVVLEPPQGTGEQYDATQKFVCKRADNVAAVFSLTTSFPKMPESQQDQVPLLQKQPAGDVSFDVQNGRLHAARLVIDRELQNHQGTGSSYRFQSTYTEQYVPGP